MRISLILLLCILSNILWPNDVLGQSTATQIEQITNTLFKNDGPGGSILVAKDGKVIYRKAFGNADLESGVKMATGSIFRIGSITKQFTACAIMKLVEEGKIALSDPITKYIPGYPATGHKVTIEHLLTHTSGIKDYTGMSKFNTSLKRTDLSPQELIEFFKNEPMDFEPGTQFRYCNSGYILLGYIIELVSKKPYAAYINESFFKPLGMQHSFYDSSSKIIHGRIPGYQRNGNSYENADFLSMSLPYAAGSLLSNVDDLYKWYNALMNNKVVSKESREKAFAPYKLSNGKLTSYGYGWSLGNVQGAEALRHVGKVNGFLTAVLFLPKEKIFVAIFSNCDCAGDLEYPASKIAALVLGDPYVFHQVVLPVKDLILYQGSYTNSDSTTKIIRCEDGKLVYFSKAGLKTRLFPLGKNKFFLENTLTMLQFENRADGTIKLLNQEGTGRPETFYRTGEKVQSINRIRPDSLPLQQYQGRYQFPGGFTFDIIKEDNKLYGQVGTDKKEILPYDRNKFYAKEIDAAIIFNVGENGDVTGLTKIQGGEMTANKVK